MSTCTCVCGHASTFQDAEGDFSQVVVRAALCMTCLDARCCGLEASPLLGCISSQTRNVCLFGPVAWPGPCCGDNEHRLHLHILEESCAHLEAALTGVHVDSAARPSSVDASPLNLQCMNEVRCQPCHPQQHVILLLIWSSLELARSDHSQYPAQHCAFTVCTAHLQKPRLGDAWVAGTQCARHWR